MTLESWQHARADLNHNWLKNRHLVAVNRWLACTMGDVEVQVGVDDLLALIREWDSTAASFRTLIADFPRCMSPRVLFEREPLMQMPAAFRHWSASTVDDLWRSRYPVNVWISSAQLAVQDMDRAASELREECWAAAGEVAGNTAIAKALNGYAHALHVLADAISAFPAVPLVV